jgi:hypothetical protein
MKEGGLNCRQITDKLNGEGVTSWGGKRFYPELVFGVIRKRTVRNAQLFTNLSIEATLVTNT